MICTGTLALSGHFLIKWRSRLRMCQVLYTTKCQVFLLVRCFNFRLSRANDASNRFWHFHRAAGIRYSEWYKYKQVVSLWTRVSFNQSWIRRVAWTSNSSSTIVITSAPILWRCDIAITIPRKREVIDLNGDHTITKVAVLTGERPTYRSKTRSP